MGWEDLFKNLDDATKVAQDGISKIKPAEVIKEGKDAKNTKKGFEAFGAAVQGGVTTADQALSADPGFVGKVYGDFKTGLGGAMTLAEYQHEKTWNKNNLTPEQIQEKYNPRFKQLLKQDKESTQMRELSKIGKEEAEKKSKGKQTAAGHMDILRNSLDETASMGLGALNRASAAVEEVGEKVGLAKERKYEDRVKEGDIAIDRLKRTHRNDDFMAFNQYENFDPETLKYWDPEVKTAFLNKINHPDIDFHEEAQRAKMLREKEASSKILQQQINEGKITREEAIKLITAQENSLGLRKGVSEIVDDPLNIIDVAEIGSSLGKKAMKGIGELSKLRSIGNPKIEETIADVGKHLDGGEAKLTPSTTEPIVSDLPTSEVPKIEPQAMPKSKESLVSDYENTIKEQTKINKALDDGKITPEEYSQASEALEANKAKALIDLKDMHGVEAEHILKSPEVHAQEVIQDVKKMNPGITNQDAVKEVMAQKKLLHNEELISKSDEIVNRFMSNDGLDPDPIMKNSILSKAPIPYTPPKLTINEKGVLAHNINDLTPSQPVQLEFTNSLQRILFEFSVPYNKAIGEGMGFRSWDQYKNSMEEINKVVIQPLAKAIFGDAPTAKQISKLKENLGAMKGHIDKECARRGNIPGQVINIGETGNLNDMVNDLIRGNVDTTSRASSDVGGFYEPPSKVDSATFQRMRDKSNVEIQNLMVGHGLTEQEAQSLVRGAPSIVSNKLLSGPAMSDGLNIAINEGRMTKGEAKVIDKKAAIQHEKLHVSIEHLYQNGVGDILESKLMALENAMPAKAGEQYQRFFDMLDPPSERDFVDELSAYIRQYRVAMEHPRGFEVVKQYDALNFIHQNPEMRKELFKWDDMMRKQEELWAVDRAKIVRESGKLKPGEITTRKIDMNSYTDNSSNLKAMQYDEVNRQDRLKQLLGPDQQYHEGRPVTFRGEDDLYDPQILPGGDDAMLGEGHYSTTNFNQATKYTGITGYEGAHALESGNVEDLGRMASNTNKSLQAGKKPQLYQEAIELEKPLFADETMKSDMINSFKNTDDEIVKSILNYVQEDNDFRKTKSVGALIGNISNYADEMGLDRADVWKRFKKEILDPNGYDGMVSPPTDMVDVGPEGLEIASFNLHQVKRHVGKNKYGFGEYKNIEKR